jgi:hypothetical protein
VNHLDLVEHPEHVLGRGHDVGRRHVDMRAQVFRQLPHPAAADCFLLAHAQVVRVADDAALAAAERNVHHGALPRHPRREGANGVERFVG